MYLPRTCRVSIKQGILDKRNKYIPHTECANEIRRTQLDLLDKACNQVCTIDIPKNRVSIVVNMRVLKNSKRVKANSCKTCTV